MGNGGVLGNFRKKNYMDLYSKKTNFKSIFRLLNIVNCPLIRPLWEILACFGGKKWRVFIITGFRASIKNKTSKTHLYP